MERSWEELLDTLRVLFGSKEVECGECEGLLVGGRFTVMKNYGNVKKIDASDVCLISLQTEIQTS